MSLKRLGIIAGVASIWLTVAVAVFSGVVWAMDTRYPTYAVMDAVFNRFRLALINDSIWDIETKIKLGELSKFDDLKLDRLNRQRQEILQGPE
jgi:hypothetical protein